MTENNTVNYIASLGVELECYRHRGMYIMQKGNTPVFREKVSFSDAAEKISTRVGKKPSQIHLNDIFAYIQANIENFYVTSDSSIEPVDYESDISRKVWATIRDTSIKWDGDFDEVSSLVFLNPEILYWTKLDENGGFKNLEDFLHFFYDDVKIKTNESCGFHIHTRFTDNFVYSLFAYKKYYDMYIAEYIKNFENKGKYLERFENRFCRNIYDDETPKLIDWVVNHIFEKNWYAKKTKIRLNRFSRYCVMNYLSLLEDHRTLEWRLMPNMESAEEAIDAIKWHINTINNIVEAYKNDNQIEMHKGMHMKKENNTFELTIPEYPEQLRENIVVYD